MSITQVLKGTAATALAATMMFAAQSAQAQDRGRHHGDRGDRGARVESPRGGNDHRDWSRSSTPSNRGNWNQHADQQRQAINDRRNAVEIRREAVRQRFDAGRNDSYAAQRNRSYTGDRDRSYGADRQIERPSDERHDNIDRSGWRDGRQADRRDDRHDWRGDRHDWRGDRHDWREDRHDWRGDRHDWREDRRDWREDRNDRHGGYRDSHRADHRDYNRWNRDDWRRDHRYGWQDYRRSHRDVYRLSRYYSPYRNYSYRRLAIGFTLNTLFYSNRYWINDPWQYRLPPVYGPYRWVRYYDDALLVNVYTGEVVDVIYGIFW